MGKALEELILHGAAFCLTVAIVYGLMITWFRTETFPGLVFGGLKKIGWRRHWDAWPPDEDLEHGWLRSEWEEWADFHLGLLGSLLRCPICLSWHLTFWTTLVVWLAALAVHPLHILFLPATVPAAVGILYILYSRT